MDHPSIIYRLDDVPSSYEVTVTLPAAAYWHLFVEAVQQDYKVSEWLAVLAQAYVHDRLKTERSKQAVIQGKQASGDTYA